MNPTGRHAQKRRRHGEGTSLRRSVRRGDDHRRHKPYMVAISLGTDPLTGKRLRRYFYGATPAEARERADDWLHQAVPADPDEEPDPTVGEMLDRWLEDERRAVKPGTWDRYEVTVRRYLKRDLGELPLRDLKAARIRAAIPLWGAAHNQWYAFHRLRAALAWALRQDDLAELLPRNPSDGVRAPAKPKGRVAPVIGPERARTILAAMADDVFAALTVVLVALGLRRGEALGLRWQYVDFEARTIKTPYQLLRTPTKVRTKEETEAGILFRLVEVKRERSDRLIPFGDVVEAALRARQAAQARQRAACGAAWPDNDLVFTDDEGYHLVPNTVSNHIQATLKRAGLGHLRLHDLRHGASTLLSVVGAPERIKMGILGHTRPAQSIDYTGFVPEEARRAVNAVEGLLTPTDVPPTWPNGCPDGCPDLRGGSPAGDTITSGPQDVAP